MLDSLFADASYGVLHTISIDDGVASAIRMAKHIGERARQGDEAAMQQLRKYVYAEAKLSALDLCFGKRVAK